MVCGQKEAFKIETKSAILTVRFYQSSLTNQQLWNAIAAQGQIPPILSNLFAFFAQRRNSR
jgi:hypothetical protein